jgi:two-component system, NarL family, nitrate/nitrite response regulator NarL
MERRIRIVVIDDHPLMRKGIVATFENHDDVLEVVGVGTTPQDAILLADEKIPDIVLMDIGNSIGSLGTTAHICSTHPNVKMVILAASEHPENVVLAFDVGAKGYISKGISSEELVRAMISVAQGNTYVSPELAGKIFAPNGKDTSRQFEAEGRLRALSAREFEVLELLNCGKSNKDIASQLDIAEKTVKYYLTLIFGKLAVKNRLEAVIFLRDTHHNTDLWMRP